MRILAIDSATEACSVALFDDGEPIGHFHQVLGRGHAEHLVPAIAALPDKGRADRILVSLGPGSFTGVRIGLALVAAIAREQHPDEPVSVCMAGGHGEWFLHDFGADGLPESPLVSVRPSDAHDLGNHRIVAGNRARDRADLGGCGQIALDLLPDACLALLLPPALFTTDLAPIYGRGPDARLPGGVAA